MFTNDILEKKARYIQGNNQLMQEFSFASCMTKLFINKVFNSHHYGSVLWDLYGREAEMVCNTWNVSIRKMLRIDRKSHRYLIEPLSGIKHLKRTLLEAFMNFTKKLSNSPKKAVKNVYDFIQKGLQECYRIEHTKYIFGMCCRWTSSILWYQYKNTGFLLLATGGRMENTNYPRINRYERWFKG